MSTALKRPSRPRRGVTLVEMLVVVALVVLMMVILVQIFQSALGAMSASRTTQELDVVLRSIDSMMRSDLNGVTAKMTPPNDPAQKQGYFEYGENAASDLQGEDTDDFLAFTTKAPEGQVFTGRQWLLGSAGMPVNQAIQPATVSSQVAEVVYFLRNGNLYRRVFLVSPERKGSITQSGSSGLTRGTYQTSMFGGSTPLKVSWQGMNDISCRPGGNFNGGPLPPIPNDLGDLTNRENRRFSPRFSNDFSSPSGNGADGIPDDFNADGVPDYYPTLYFDGSGYLPMNSNNVQVGWAPNHFVNEFHPYPSQGSLQRVQQHNPNGNAWDVYAFPYIYPGMYSVPDQGRVQNGLGWVHYLYPSATGFLNHAPLDLGETPNFTPTGSQTWWGFPTWRETMAGLSGVAGKGGWNDPIANLNANQQQPLGLKPFNPSVMPSINSPTFLPQVTNYGTGVQPYGYDNAGSNNFIASSIATPAAEATLWQDDLILTNVRSFDVKAFDPNAPLYNTSVGTYLSTGYWDLGYAGLSPSTYAPNYASTSTIWGPNGQGAGSVQKAVPFQAINSEPQGFGHEGRIPPLPGDYRLDPRRPFINNPYPNAYTPLSGTVANNIGDPSPGVTRLTHTFDTWSTDYTNAPTSDIFLWEQSQYTAPVMPAFPPPYPSPLRGIQIQIRVTDPRNERTKVLTIRHDFSDKL
jgi:type II secretory pathway component PulJ